MSTENVDPNFVMLGMQMALLRSNARIEALLEALEKILPEVESKPLEDWVEERQKKHISHDFCRMEDMNAHYAAVAQSIFDAVSALDQKPGQQH